MPDIADTIIQVSDHFFGEALREVKSRLASITLHGSHRRFLVSRMGSTGSTWLAKLFNSHPDVFCYHEGVIAKIFPASSYGMEERLSLIKLLAEDSMHGAYAAAGDVGSAGLGYAVATPKGTFSTGLLLRHPARVLNTRLKVFPADRSFTQINEKRLKCVECIWNIDTSGLTEIDRIFLQDACVFAQQIQWLNAVNVVAQIERMNDVEYCRRVARVLTGQDYEDSVLERLMSNRVNSRTHSDGSVRETLDGFTPSQRAWYELMLGDLLPRFGYSLHE